MPSRKYTQETLFEMAVEWMRQSGEPMSTRSWTHPSPAGKPPFPLAALSYHYGGLHRFWDKLVSRGKMTPEEASRLKRRRYNSAAQKAQRQKQSLSGTRMLPLTDGVPLW